MSRFRKPGRIINFTLMQIPGLNMAFLLLGFEYCQCSYIIHKIQGHTWKKSPQTREWPFHLFIFILYRNAHCSPLFNFLPKFSSTVLSILINGFCIHRFYLNMSIIRYSLCIYILILYNVLFI